MRTPLRLALLAASVLGGAACVHLPMAGHDFRHAQAILVNQAAFEHGCPVQSVRVLRSDAWGTTQDLDVCGNVRRYKVLLAPGGAGTDGLTWLDVTVNYPESTLPAAAPPSTDPPAPRK
ncbi:MAG: hypothetical protein U0229_21405 [Anaeromyxobacter sp.]